MTRRILAAMLTLTAVLLLGAIIPLGLDVDKQHDRDFRENAVNTARVAASSAEEQLVDNEPGTGLVRTIARLRGPGETVIVVDASGHTVAAAGPGLSETAPLIATSLAGGTTTDEDAERLVAAVPVHGHTGVAGAVLFARPLQPLQQRTHREWIRLGVVAALAVAAALLLAIGLARWVGRPLRTLEQAAEALGGGDLGARAAAETGPGEVRQLARRFNVMAARLETLLYDHRIVLADVAHQLRTPLAALRLRLELLTDEAAPQTATDLENALGELARLSRLVDGLLAIARAENTTNPPVPVIVGDILTERADAWRPVAAERDVDLQVKVPEGLVALTGTGHLEQVLDNLIDNALSAEGDRVRLTAARTAGDIQITVADNGPGMAEVDRERAFLRFETGRSSGTGLGLAIVHRLVTADSGRLALQETPGGGLTVTITLPAAP
jgi:signal transduction histidine kinase